MTPRCCIDSISFCFSWGARSCLLQCLSVFSSYLPLPFRFRFPRFPSTLRKCCCDSWLYTFQTAQNYAVSTRFQTRYRLEILKFVPSFHSSSFWLVRFLFYLWRWGFEGGPTTCRWFQSLRLCFTLSALPFGTISVQSCLETPASGSGISWPLRSVALRLLTGCCSLASLKILPICHKNFLAIFYETLEIFRILLRCYAKFLWFCWPLAFPFGRGILTSDVRMSFQTHLKSPRSSATLRFAFVSKTFPCSPRSSAASSSQKSSSRWCFLPLFLPSVSKPSE